MTFPLEVHDFLTEIHVALNPKPTQQSPPSPFTQELVNEQLKLMDPSYYKHKLDRRKTEYNLMTKEILRMKKEETKLKELLMKFREEIDFFKAKEKAYLSNLNTLKIECSAAQDKSNAYESQYKDNLIENVQLTNQIFELNTEKRRTNNEISKLKEENRELSQTLQEFRQNFQIQKFNFDQMDEYLRQLLGKINQVSKEVEKSRVETQTLNVSINKLTANLNSRAQKRKNESAFPAAKKQKVMPSDSQNSTDLPNQQLNLPQNVNRQKETNLPELPIECQGDTAAAPYNETQEFWNFFGYI